MRHLAAFLALFAFAAPAVVAQEAGEIEVTLELIKEWLGGTYDNSAQVEMDIANNVPADERFISIHQIVMPLEIEGFDGLMFFQQLSNDGTPDTLLQVHLYQYEPDPDSGMVRRRLHLFNDENRYINAHLDLSKFDGLTMDDVHPPDTSGGCDYHFSPSDDRTELIGVMMGEGCFPIHPETGQKIQHIDELIIKDGQIWNNPTYYNLDGNLLFGNVTGDYQKQVRIDR